MIAGAELGLLIYGIFVLIKGRYSLGKGRKVVGPKARILGAVCLIPIPLSMVVGTLIGMFFSQAVVSGQLKGLVVCLEIAILICTVFVLVLLSKHYYNQQPASDQPT